MSEQKETTEELQPTKEVEALKQEKGALARELELKEGMIAKMRQELAGKDGELASLKQAIAEA